MPRPWPLGTPSTQAKGHRRAGAGRLTRRAQLQGGRPTQLVASATGPPWAAALSKARLCPVPPAHLFIRVQPSLPRINKVRGVLAVPEEQQACTAKRGSQDTVVACSGRRWVACYRSWSCCARAQAPCGALPHGTFTVSAAGGTHQCSWLSGWPLSSPNRRRPCRSAGPDRRCWPVCGPGGSAQSTRWGLQAGGVGRSNALCTWYAHN